LKVTLSPWQIAVSDEIIETAGVHAPGGGPIKQMLKLLVLSDADMFKTRM
jgi:hypothetical protein